MSLTHITLQITNIAITRLRTSLFEKVCYCMDNKKAIYPDKIGCQPQQPSTSLSHVSFQRIARRLEGIFSLPSMFEYLWLLKTMILVYKMVYTIVAVF